MGLRHPHKPSEYPSFWLYLLDEVSDGSSTLRHPSPYDPSPSFGEAALVRLVPTTSSFFLVACSQ